MAKQTYKKHLNKKPKYKPTYEKKDEVKIDSITYHDGITVGDLANKLHKNSGDIIKILFMLGKMVTINSVLDDENIELVCMEFDVDAVKEEKQETVETRTETTSEKCYLAIEEADLMKNEINVLKREIEALRGLVAENKKEVASA